MTDLNFIQFVSDRQTHINDVLAGYVEAALFTESDESDDSVGDTLDALYGQDDIHADTLADMRADVTSFLADNADTLSRAQSTYDYPDHPSQIGHDLWLTRNGHGAGFWDRGLGSLGKELTDAAKPMGSYRLWVGDHVVHGDDGMIHGEAR